MYLNCDGERRMGRGFVVCAAPLLEGLRNFVVCILYNSAAIIVVNALGKSYTCCTYVSRRKDCFGNDGGDLLAQHNDKVVASYSS